MKTTINAKWAGVAFAAIAFMGLSPSAKALLDLGGYVGPITIHISSLDNGAVYSTIGSGTAATLTNGSTYAGSTTSAATGVAALNALGQTPAGNAQAALSPAVAGNEDTWAIASVDQITGSNGVLYDKTTSGFALSAMVYNGQDAAISISAGANPGDVTQTVSTVGFRVDLYQGPTNLNLGLADPSGHNAPGAFVVAGSNTVNLTGAPNSLILSLAGAPGIIGGGLATNPGGALTELLSTFNTQGNTGSGTAYLNVTGGIDATQFDTNKQTGGTDVKIAYSDGQDVNQFSWYHSPWLVADSDPISASVIPEPSTVAAGLACLLPMFGAGVRRFRKLNRLTS